LSASSIAAGRPHARSTRSSSRSAASTTWRSLTANAGSAPWRPHDLRHTFAYRLSEPQGEPVSAGRLRRRPIRGDEAGPARPVLRDDVIAGRPRVQSMQD
jgi:integrase